MPNTPQHPFYDTPLFRSFSRLMVAGGLEEGVIAGLPPAPRRGERAETPKYLDVAVQATAGSPAEVFQRLSQRISDKMDPERATGLASPSEAFSPREMCTLGQNRLMVSVGGCKFTVAVHGAGQPLTGESVSFKPVDPPPSDARPTQKTKQRKQPAAARA